MDETENIPPPLTGIAVATAEAAPEAGTPAWHAQRQSILGGADMGAIMGLSPWSTPLEVFLVKRGELTPKPPNESMEWGNRLEPVILEAYRDKTGREVYKPRSMLRHAVHRFMGGHVDGITARGDRLVEVKTAFSQDGWGPEGSDEIPDVYAIQAQHYLYVTGYEVCDVVVLFGGSRLVIYQVRQDPELQGLIVDAGKSFWARVVENLPPEPRGIEDIRLRYGRVNARGNMAANATHLEWVQTLKDAREQAAALAIVEDEMKAKLMLALGNDADTLLGPDGKALVTWKLAKAAVRLDTEKFKEDHPGIYAAYLHEGKASRRFLIK